jgi:hypothetical protein
MEPIQQDITTLQALTYENVSVPRIPHAEAVYVPVLVHITKPAHVPAIPMQQAAFLTLESLTVQNIRILNADAPSLRSFIVVT